MSYTRAARRPPASLHRLLAAALILGLCSPLAARGQEPPALAGFHHLAGGTWIGQGTWPDGSPLRVEQRYFWGPTEQLLHFETWNLAADTRELLYEGVLYVDPVSRRVVQINVQSDGQVTRQEVARWDADGYEIHGPDTRSIVRHGGSDLFTWELRVMQEGEWKPILEAEYRRRAQDREPLGP